MRKVLIGALAVLLLAGMTFFQMKSKGSEQNLFPETDLVVLPSPQTKGQVSLEEAIFQRRSRRDFNEKPLTPEHLSQILWSGQGVTGGEGFKRSAPSAGALYPLEIYVVVGENSVENLEAGVYHYLPSKHALEKTQSGDLRNELAQAALGQYFLAQAPVILVISADYERTTGKYGQRGVRYVHIEVGHVGENIYLQAEALGLGTVTVGAFNDQEVLRILKLPLNHQPLYLMPLGWPK